MIFGRLHGLPMYTMSMVFLHDNDMVMVTVVGYFFCALGYQFSKWISLSLFLGFGISFLKWKVAKNEVFVFSNKLIQFTFDACKI